MRSEDDGQQGPVGVDFPALDEGFLKRTYRTTGVVAAIVFVWIACVQPAKMALNFALGAALSLVLLRVTEVSVRGGFRGVATRGRWAATAAHVFKYGLVGVGFWLLFRFDLAVPEWIAAGYSVLLAVVTLKIAGILLNRSLAASDERKRAQHGE